VGVVVVVAVEARVEEEGVQVLQIRQIVAGGAGGEVS